jgi:outer membrane protein OmpA-like peptidoglycan-associated protein
MFMALLCVNAPALAQVTIDLHALDALPGARPAKPEAVPHAAKRKPAPTQVTTAKPHKAPAAETATAVTPPLPPAAQPAAPPPAAAATPPPATVPAAPPGAVALAPIAPPPPSSEPAPPPPPPISESSSSAAVPSNAGLRVTFGAGQADLSPASAAAIQQMVKSAPSGDATSFNVVAYAAGTPDDPSTARRLSLSRALAVRSALMADGITSSRIYVRALGAAPGDDAPDRVELAVMGANAASQTTEQAGSKSATP